MTELESATVTTRENLMKPMYFELCHNPENKTLAIPRAALQLSGLADAEELILLTGGDMSWWHETR